MRIYWVYILNCANGSYYTGYTTHLMRRYQEHVAGTGKCKYTRSFKPISIAQCWQIFDNKATAMKIEKFIKRLPKQKKKELVLNPGYLVEWMLLR